MRMAWVLGWAIPRRWFAAQVQRAFPEAEHAYFPAASEAVEQVLAAGPFDLTSGYSLGAHLLLDAHARGAALGRVALLAPIFAFPREENLGGRIARAQVRWLGRLLSRDSQTALADFYLRAGLTIPLELAPCAEIDLLRWGLEMLERSRVEPPLPAGWQAWCGNADALLDSFRLREVAPEIEIIANATHHPEKLLRAMAKEIR